MVLAMPKGISLILLYAAASVTAPDGTNGKTLSKRTMKKARWPSALWSFEKKLLLFSLGKEEVSLVIPLR